MTARSAQARGTPCGTGWAAWFHETLTPSTASGVGDNAGMDITLNGAARRIEGASPTIAHLLQAEGLGERRVAVEVNGEIVPKGSHDKHLLQAGDRVEIVHALGGG